MAGLFYPCECCSRELNAQKLQLVKNSKRFSVKKEKRQVEKKLVVILFRFRDTSNNQGVEFSPKKRRRLIHLYPCLIIIQNFHLVFLNSIKLMINLITDAWPLDVDLLQACWKCVTCSKINKLQSYIITRNDVPLSELEFNSKLDNSL